MDVIRAAQCGWTIAWSIVYVVQALAQLYIQALDSYDPGKTLVILVLNVVSIADTASQIRQRAPYEAAYLSMATKLE